MGSPVSGDKAREIMNRETEREGRGGRREGESEGDRLFSEKREEEYTQRERSGVVARSLYPQHTPGAPGCGR